MKIHHLCSDMSKLFYSVSDSSQIWLFIVRDFVYCLGLWCRWTVWFGDGLVLTAEVVEQMAVLVSSGLSVCEGRWARHCVQPAESWKSLRAVPCPWHLGRTQPVSLHRSLTLALINISFLLCYISRNVMLPNMMDFDMLPTSSFLLCSRCAVFSHVCLLKYQKQKLNKICLSYY